MDGKDSNADYPWDKTASATLEQKAVEVISCGNCGNEWSPRVEQPKFCPNCKSQLEYADELQEDSDESTGEESAADDDEGGETDLEQLLNNEGDSE